MTGGTCAVATDGTVGTAAVDACARTDDGIRRSFGGPVPTGVEGVEMMMLFFRSAGLPVGLIFGIILSVGVCGNGVKGVSTDGVGGK